VKIFNYYVIVFFLQFVIVLSYSHIAYSLIANNPFAMNNAKIKSVKSTTQDGKYLVELEYSPEQAKKGQVTFLRIDLFDNLLNNQTRLRHVDCDLIIEKNNIELFRLSSKYGESVYHSISGTFLTSYQFNETGIYKISVKLEGINFIPIVPVLTSFSVAVPTNSSENFNIGLASQVQ
jgi:hypothetical protein